MKISFNRIHEQLEDNINELKVDDSIEFIESIITLILDSLKELKQMVLAKGFKDIEEEIYFFKKQKPNILSKLIYYNTIYKIEAKKPYAGHKTTKKYLHNELTKLKKYFDNNLEFYKYHRTNSNYLDNKYFIRGKHDIKLSLDTYYFEADHNFSTSHDYKVAKIIANDLIQVYLEDQLSNIVSENKSVTISSLRWTGTKTSLIELVYALHSIGVFDNGNNDIKHITKQFESIFNIDLGDFYHTYLELRNRKTNRTKFLDSLKESLIKKMDEQEEKLG